MHSVSLRLARKNERENRDKDALSFGEPLIGIQRVRILNSQWHRREAGTSTMKYPTFYILIREGIRFMQNGTPPVFVKCPRFETL